MNDAAWRSAFAKDWSERQRWGDLSFGDASDLARVLQEEVKADPERFLALYWTLPATTPVPFLRGILWAVAETGLDASALDGLIVRLHAGEPWQPDDRIMLWLIEQRSGDAIGAEAMKELRRIALDGGAGNPGEIKHGSQEKREPLFKTAIQTGHDLAWQGRQVPRGNALHMLAMLAWNDQTVFKDHYDTIDKLLSEDAPDWLIAAAMLFVRVAIKHDPTIGAKWVEAVARTAPIALASQFGRRCLLGLDAIAPEQGRGVLMALLEGDDPGMSAVAAAMIVARSFDSKDWESERARVLSGHDEWRAAGAQVVVEEMDAESDDPELRDLIIQFFSDRAELVRDLAVDVFRRIGTDAMERNAEIYRAFLSSPYFEGERTYFMHRLEEAPSALDGLVLELIELAASKLPLASAGHSSIGYRLWEALMRIYASHQDDPDIRKRCLDVIDTLVTRNIGGSNKLTEASR